VGSSLRANSPAPYWLPDTGGAYGGADPLGPIGKPIQAFGDWYFGAAQAAAGALLLGAALLLVGLLTLGSSSVAKKLAA
jgi:hypothetical protein